MDLGKELLKARKARKMTQTQMRDHLEMRGLRICFRTYQNWEGGKTELKLSQALKLRDILGISLNGQEESDARRCRKQPSPGE